MVKLKYASPQIAALPENDLSIWVKSLLLKIHVITGWVLPSGEIMTILKDQFKKKLQEDYDMLNVEEIEYAFRQKGTAIEDWGKEVNLNLLDKVLVPYVIKRNDISDIEQKNKRPPEQKTYSDEDILNERRAEIEKAFQAMKQGYYPIIHVYFEQVLLQDGLMEEGVTASEFFVKALGLNLDHIYVNEKTTDATTG